MYCSGVWDGVSVMSCCVGGGVACDVSVVWWCVGVVW